MALQALWANNALTTLASGITSSQTTVTLTSGSGALFPNPTSGQQQFALTVSSATNPATFEIMYCTARSSDTLTVIRGQEGTAGQAFNAGDNAQNLITAGLMAFLVQPGAPWTWTATQTYSSPIVLDNNVQLQGKNSSGTPQNLIVITSGNQVNIRGGTAGFSISNNAGSTINLSIDDSGDATVRGNLGIQGSSYCDSSVTAVTQLISNTIAVASGGTIGDVTFGGAVMTAAGGWVTGPSDPIASQNDGYQTLSTGSTQVYCTAATPFSVGGTVGALVDFFYGNTGVGSISTNGSSVSYNPTSDYRIKTTYGIADCSWMKNVIVHDAQFTNGQKSRYPMILAHELQELAPWSVRGEKDAVDKNGKPVMQQYDPMSLIPSLISYTQSLESTLDHVLARLAALETAKK